ncbi:MAG TPA: MFS transporter [bacterium]|nr:MFS transporter [bacterium]
MPDHKPAGAARLSAMMFFQLFVFGAFGPILSMYLQGTLRFSSAQTGFIMAMSVVSSIVAPLLSVYVVDRLIRAKWLFILCHIVLAISSAGMFVAHRFGIFLTLFVINSLCTGPSMGMLTAITFQRLSDLEGNTRNYGAIRVWGTLGWMAAGYLVSAVWAVLPAVFAGKAAVAFHAGAFLVASAGSVACIVLAAGMPEANRGEQPEHARIVVPLPEFLPRAALDVIRHKGTIVLFVAYLVSSIVDKLYTFGAAPYFVQMGFGEAWIPSILTLGQASEVVMLFGLGTLLSRFSYRHVILVGGLTQALRYFLLWTGIPALGLLGVGLNGLVFACLYSAILMYIDHRSDSGSRQALHQLVQLFMGGVSALVGNLLAGALGQIISISGRVDYRGFWLVSWAAAFASALFVWLLFKEDRNQGEAPV